METISIYVNYIPFIIGVFIVLGMCLGWLIHDFICSIDLYDEKQVKKFVDAKRPYITTNTMTVNAGQLRWMLDSFQCMDEELQAYEEGRYV